MWKHLKIIIMKFIFRLLPIPNLDHSEFTKFVPCPDGNQAAFYRMAELYFTSDSLMMEALSSNEGQAAAADIPKFATGGFHFLVGKV